MSSLPRKDGVDRNARVESVDQLVGFLRSGEKPPERWLVGTEHEKIGLRARDHSPIPYEGKHGIGALLERIASVSERIASASERGEGAAANAEPWSRVREEGLVIALQRETASITLEPGGQLELSGAPLRTIHETCDEFHTHLALMKRVSEEADIVWLGLGIHPLHSVEKLPAMPKERYRIMNAYLPTRGSLASSMMFATATVQANFDFADEADMVEKMRLAQLVSPIVSSIFANSSVSEGKVNGFVSKRQHIWEHTDPDRTGLLPMVFEPDFGYRRYIEWALDIPMFFIVRDDRYVRATHLSFRRFMAEGFEGQHATIGDFDQHLTTLFPDVRLKRIIEVRGADAVPPALTCSLPALWKGILYDAEAREVVRALCGDVSMEQLEACRADVARRGLGGRYAARPVAELARELTQISREGLRRIAHAGATEPDETGFLAPIFAQLDSGESPGETVRRLWEGEWERSADRLIEYARY